MEPSWLQNLNLLLNRAVGACHQTSDRRNKVVDEVKHVLLCLANRRKFSRAQLVVTNEHLNRALHYFGILILITDVTFDEEEETSIPQSDHLRNPNIADLISRHRTLNLDQARRHRQSDNQTIRMQPHMPAQLSLQSAKHPMVRSIHCPLPKKERNESLRLLDSNH
ncbi:hypothetical protein FOCG_16496 [Fusarium oxysporum f. sp. radicis-lycopersici 26381]|uniref:Uncharacterized protein n=1 Tax=Fusarium oxysporum Fo47 TaxID=660027 RepID=W9KX26_FUSOX|nr:hypothetical protein FOZG_03233 [Fusarium oxysporum Fo47]EXL41120.1 hypothetical protein FOCG_16496 [Fusarium oxysporum f. sp. radicis-lycopersici 26381]KAJ4121760.1 hypothetical protein NW765_004585 [Fusarium oxysporum]